MLFTDTGLNTAPAAVAFAMNERRRCVSDREWRHRLQGYGYDIRATVRGRVLTRVTTGSVLGRLDG